MHPEARQWAEYAVDLHGPFSRVVEFGSFNVNGGVRDLFGEAFFLGIDLKEGPGVDVAGDVLLQDLAGYDCVISTEVLEHHPDAKSVVAKAFDALDAGGVFIGTCAGPLREPHGADGGQVKPGEHYRNVTEADIVAWLEAAGFSWWKVDMTGIDVRWWAIRGTR